LDFEHKIDPTGLVNLVKTFNKRNFDIDSNVAFLNSEHGQQSMCGTSYMNDANVRDALDLADNLHNAMGASFDSIVILTGYEGQYRAYLQEADRRSNNSQIPWLDLNIQKIETFQGSECDFVIFDAVRTKGLGFMANFRRWHVALSRARFGLWVMYSDTVLRTDPFAKTSKYIQGMREFASSKQLKVTLKKPEYESFPEIPQGKSVTTSGVSAHNKLRAAYAARRAARRAANVSEASATGETSTASEAPTTSEASDW
jgi:Superfamily I DNA and RNA helicases and helicase subunits